MDKPLTDKSKSAESPAQEHDVKTSPADVKAVSAEPVAPETSPQPTNQTLDPSKPIGAYGEQTTKPLVTKKAWNEIDPHKAWADDPKSRLAIRMFSRGLLGAAFFTTGGLLAKKWMAGYDASKSLAQQTQKNPLTFIAKLIDSTIGHGIESTVTKIAGKEAGMNAVRFRPTRYSQRWGTGELRGRSLGDEAVNITFDFFCASIGDAWGRDIAGWFDPNVKKDWMDDKGNIKAPEALNAAAKALGRYVTYNGGEDWAVAIPYAYFMKGQRSLINGKSPGFKYDFDRALNGGSFKLKDSKIVGNYQLEGLMDLQSRFTAYNVGTLMYREAYDYIGNTLSGKPAKLYGAPDSEEHKSLLGKAGDLLKWVARSTIKGVVIMTPAVPFFWITRTPQTQHKGAFIDPEKGILGGLESKNEPLYANSPIQSPDQQLSYMRHVYEPSAKHPSNFDSIKFTPAGAVADFNPAFTQPHPVLSNQSSFNPYGQKFGGIDKILNPIGSANYNLANSADGLARWADNAAGIRGDRFKNAIGIANDSGPNFRNFTRPMVYAAASYTPYMYAKAEFANLWDNGKMDMAAERLIDGAVKLNWGEFKAGVGEVWHSILRKPLADPKREAEGQRRIQIDTSAADAFSKTQAQIAEDNKKAKSLSAAEAAKPQSQDLSWQERIISSKQEPKKQELQAEKPKPQKNYADQEALRKVLEEHNPPTNSIN